MTELERLIDIADRARIMLRTMIDPASKTALIDYAEECEAKAAAIVRSGGASDQRRDAVLPPPLVDL